MGTQLEKEEKMSGDVRQKIEGVRNIPDSLGSCTEESRLRNLCKLRSLGFDPLGFDPDCTDEDTDDLNGPRVLLYAYLDLYRDDSNTYSSRDRARLARDAVLQVMDQFLNWEDDNVLLFMFADALKVVIGAVLHHQKETRRLQGKAHDSERPLPRDGSDLNEAAYSLLRIIHRRSVDEPRLRLVIAPDLMLAAHRSGRSDTEGRMRSRRVYDLTKTILQTYEGSDHPLLDARAWRTYHQLRIGYHKRHGEPVTDLDAVQLVKDAKSKLDALDKLGDMGDFDVMVVAHEKANLHDFIIQVCYPPKGETWDVFLYEDTVQSFYLLNILEPERFLPPRSSDSRVVVAFGKRVRPLLIANKRLTERFPEAYARLEDEFKIFIFQKEIASTILGQWNQQNDDDSAQSSSHSPAGPSVVPPNGRDFTASSQLSSSTSRKAELATLM